MVLAKRESVPLLDGERQVVIDLSRQVHNGFALLANQMMMSVLGQVIDRASMAEVHVIDDAKFLQRFERPIHRRKMHLGGRCLHDHGNIFRSDVPVRADQRLKHRSASTRDAHATRPQILEKAGRRFAFHAYDPNSCPTALHSVIWRWDFNRHTLAAAGEALIDAAS